MLEIINEKLLLWLFRLKQKMFFFVLNTNTFLVILFQVMKLTYGKRRILGSYIPSYKIVCIKLLSKIHIQEDNARKAQAINPMGVIWLCKKCVSTASLLINDIDYEFPNVLHHKKMAK